MAQVSNFTILIDSSMDAAIWAIAHPGAALTDFSQ